MAVCLFAAPQVQLSVSVGNGWPHNALRYHWPMPISYRTTSEIVCKHGWSLVTSLTRVSDAMSNVTFSDILLTQRNKQTKETPARHIYRGAHWKIRLKSHFLVC